MHFNTKKPRGKNFAYFSFIEKETINLTRQIICMVFFCVSQKLSPNTFAVILKAPLAPPSSSRIRPLPVLLHWRIKCRWFIDWMAWGQRSRSAAPELRTVWCFMAVRFLLHLRRRGLFWPLPPPPTAVPPPQHTHPVRRCDLSDQQGSPVSHGSQ